MTYNDDYQQRQREDDRRRRDEEDSRRRDDENRRRRDEEDRRQRDQDDRQREANNRREQERQAEIKRQLDEAAEARNRDLELKARQLKTDLELKARQLKIDLDKNAVELRKDLNARVDRERAESDKAMDRKIALKHAEAMSQQLSERRKQKENANYSSGVTGILSDSISIAAAMRAMTGVSSDESSTFLDRNNVARTLSDLSQSDIEIIRSEIKLQKQGNANDTEMNHSAEVIKDVPAGKAPIKKVRQSILDENWNHDIKIRSEERAEEMRNVITNIPEIKWLTAIKSKTDNLSVENWKYPTKLSDTKVLGTAGFAEEIWEIIKKHYYKKLISVIKQPGDPLYAKESIHVLLKRDAHVILKLYPGVTESDIVNPVVAVQRVPITTDVIDLLRHGDLIGFNLKHKSSESDMTEEGLRRLVEKGSIYHYTYQCCSRLEREALASAQKTGENLGKTVLAYIEQLLDGKNWEHHWEKKYGRPPTKGEVLRATGLDFIILTDEEINAKERAEKEAYWKSLSLMEKVKHKFTNRP